MKLIVIAIFKTILMLWLAILVAWFSVHDAFGATPRGRHAPQAFQKLSPCPANGKTSGACPGWIKDHIVPLYCNGPDTPANLQWQTVEESRAKDRWELQCWRYVPQKATQ